MGSCLSCEAEANNRQQALERIKLEALEYGKKNQVDLAVYMEAGEWKYLRVETAIALKIPFAHVVRFNPCSAA